MEIRKATFADAQALWQAELDIAKTPGRLVSRPEELTLDAFVAKIRQLHSEESYVVAVEDGVVVGHALLERMPLAALKHVVRLTIAVHPGHSGRGVGTALMKHLQDWARNDAATQKIELMVRETNPDAVRLYRHLGFVEEGRFKRRVRLPDGRFVDDIAMAWFPGE